MSLIKVVPYVLGVTHGVPGAPEPRMYPRSGYFLVSNNSVLLVILISTTFAPLGSSRVSDEAKNYRELEFLGLSHCFSVLIE